MNKESNLDLLEMPNLANKYFTKILIKSLKSSVYAFYANVLTKFTLDYRPNDKYLAGVYIKNETVFLVLNYEFFTLPLNIQQGILKHEVLHIILKHLTFRKYKDYEHKLWNIATDCAINQEIYLNDLPKDCITPNYLNRKIGMMIEIEQYKNSEYYYNLLIKYKDRFNLDELFDNTIDEFEISDDDNIEALKKDILIKSILTNANDSGYIANSHLISLMLQEESVINNGHTIQWKDKIKRILCDNKIADYNRTFKVRNRRFIDRIDIKGHVRQREDVFNLLLIIDVSGSMNKNIIAKGLGEVKSFIESLNNNINIKMIQVDTEAHLIENFDKKLNKFTRHSSGGTYVSNALILAKDLNIKYNLVIMISDCELVKADIKQFDELTKQKTLILKVTNRGSYISGYMLKSEIPQFNNCKIQVLDLI